MAKAKKLIPSLKDNLWGGNRLREYGKVSDGDVIAESWELSYVPGSESVVDGGERIDIAYPRERWGANAQHFEFFPILTKFIDAKDKLSVQVHPDDEYALERENSFGKTEMWYVVEAQEGSGLYMGLNRHAEKSEVATAIANGTVEDYLAFVSVKAGDVYFIPSGTIHAIGSGVLIYEIQQNSTLTYRMYDYMRRDKMGNLRELHVEKALSVAKTEVYEPIDFSEYGDGVIGKCEYFKTTKRKLNFAKHKYFVSDDSFLCLTCVEGEGTVDGQKCSRGDSFFIPAGEGEVEVMGDMTLIEVVVPKSE